MARAHEVQIKEAPDCLLTGSPWDGLSEAIWARFMRAQQSEVTYTRKMMLWGQLYMLIKHSYPKWSLYLVGSTLSGFGADTSDIDMCLVSRISSQMDPRMEALVNLNDLKSFLSKTTGKNSHSSLTSKSLLIILYFSRTFPRLCFNCCQSSNIEI